MIVRARTRRGSGESHAHVRSSLGKACGSRSVRIVSGRSNGGGGVIFETLLYTSVCIC